MSRKKPKAGKTGKRRIFPARKKNLNDWIFALSCGFDFSACHNCKDEKDEYIEGKPACAALGKCKHFNHIKHTAFPQGNPMRFITAGGLLEFEIITEKMISLSSWDSMNLPTIDFYPHTAGQTDLDEEEFQDLLQLKFNFIKTDIINRRKRKIQHNG